MVIGITEKKPVIQVFPEGALPDHFFEVLICRCYDPNVNDDGLVSAHPLKAHVLNHMKDLDLQMQRHIPDLIKEDRSVVCQLQICRSFPCRSLR